MQVGIGRPLQLFTLDEGRVVDQKLASLLLVHEDILEGVVAVLQVEDRDIRLAARFQRTEMIEMDRLGRLAGGALDGVLDRQDQCPDTPMGPTPDPRRPGCPASDSDNDGVLDPVDQCLFEPAGPNPDPARLGCPLPDRDHDTVPDPRDACPDKPGSPNPDPKKNGCPGLVEVKNGQLVLLKPVFFALDKDVILAQSFPVLQAVADALQATPAIKKIRIEGHTDSQGKPAYNLDLSDRRTRSVSKWLVAHGIAESRLEARGYGQLRPIDTNATPAGRARNRRVEFLILEGPGVTDKNL